MYICILTCWCPSDYRIKIVIKHDFYNTNTKCYKITLTIILQLSYSIIRLLIK